MQVYLKPKPGKNGKPRKPRKHDNIPIQIDECDLWLLDKYSYYILSTKHRRSVVDTKYVARSVSIPKSQSSTGRKSSTTIHLHKDIAIRLGLIGQVDHKNGDTLDNRIENLRSATHQQNSSNKGLRSDNTSGFPGVRLCKNVLSTNRCWHAQVMIKGQFVYNEYFHTFEEAKTARIEAANRLMGEHSPYLSRPN